MTREEICNSMTVQDAVRVLKETNCYGTMDIAKTVIIKALEQHQHYKDLAESYEKTINKLTKAIAEEQQKTGRWIGADGTTVYVNSEGNVTESRDKGEAVKCSECGEWLVGSDEYVCGGRFCPSCGIKMEEKK